MMIFNFKPEEDCGTECNRRSVKRQWGDGLRNKKTIDTDGSFQIQCIKKSCHWETGRIRWMSPRKKETRWTKNQDITWLCEFNWKLVPTIGELMHDEMKNFHSEFAKKLL